MSTRNGQSAVFKQPAIPQMVRVGDLNVDPSYQRDPIPAHLKKLRGEFDPNALGAVTVSRRRNGKLYVLDGQHRVALVQGLHGEDAKIACVVIEGLDVLEEARVFVIMNRDARKPQPHQVYRASLRAKDPRTLAIDAIVKGRGFIVGNVDQEGVIRAVNALYRGYAKDTLERQLDVVTAAWGADYTGVKHEILEALRLMFELYEDDVDTDHLAGVLGEFEGGASSLFLKGKDRRIQDGRRYGYEHGVLPLMIEAYNEGLEEDDKLPYVGRRPATV